jgi:hypothetical protein
MASSTCVVQVPSPAPGISAIEVDKLKGATITPNDKKKSRLRDSTNINSPQSQHQLNKEAEPTPETKALIKSVLAVGKEWQSRRKTATGYFEEHKLEVLKLRTGFGVKQGTKGRMLYVPQPDGTLRAMYWSEFVRLAFGVGERHVNRLLGVPNEPSAPSKPENNKNYKLGFVAGQEAALRGQVQAPVVAAPVSKLDKQDPYAFFGQLNVVPSAKPVVAVDHSVCTADRSGSSRKFHPRTAAPLRPPARADAARDHAPSPP